MRTINYSTHLLMIVQYLLRRITFFGISMLFVISVMSGCGDSGPTAPDTKVLLTSGTWKINTVTVDGVNQDELFTNFSISFTATSFTSTPGGALWPASGTWAFANSDQKAFTRNDGVEVTLESISETALTLKLTWNKTTLGGGRVASTQGNYIFTFSK